MRRLPFLALAVAAAVLVSGCGHTATPQAPPSAPQIAASPVPSPTPQGPVCGNRLCEVDETYDTCPTDCVLPSSIEPSIAKIKIAESDLPTPPDYGGRNTTWFKSVDTSIDESYLLPLLRGFGLLAGREVAIFVSWDGVDVNLAWVRQKILVYPSDKVTKAFDAITVASFAPLKAEELPNPNIGEGSKAFRVTAPDGKTQHMVFFIKKGYLEMLSLEGTAFEYKVLVDIAKKAADKISS